MSLSAASCLAPCRANRVAAATLRENRGGLEAAPVLAIRWGLSANVKFMLRERTGKDGRRCGRKPLICKGFRVRLGSGPDGTPHPPFDSSARSTGALNYWRLEKWEAHGEGPGGAFALRGGDRG